MSEDREPQLDDIVFETYGPDGDPHEVRRAFVVVGIEEPAPRRRWGIVLERVDYMEAIRASLDGPWWCFYRDRSRGRG